MKTSVVSVVDRSAGGTLEADGMFSVRVLTGGILPRAPGAFFGPCSFPQHGGTAEWELVGFGVPIEDGGERAPSGVVG